MADAAEAPDVRAAEAEAAEAARAVAELARTALAEAAREARRSRTRRSRDARARSKNAEREAQRLSAEAKALGDLLRPDGADLWPPLVDAVKVQPGYEAALAAALGDDLQAPLDEAAPHHWRDLGPLDDAAALPEGAKPLGEFVDGAVRARAPPGDDRRRVPGSGRGAAEVA